MVAAGGDEQVFSDPWEELHAWAQEYANLCRVVACCPRTQGDTYLRLVENLEYTLSRGKAMCDRLASRGRAQSGRVTESSYPVNAAASVDRRPLIPVVGSCRAASGRAMAVPSLSQSLTAVDFEGELVPSRSYRRNKKSD